MIVQLCRLLVDIAVWRRGPQDLPASSVLVALLLVVYAMLGAIQVTIKGWPWLGSAGIMVCEVGLQALWLWGLLWFFGKRPRFLQTFAAYLGVGLLLTVADLLVGGLLQFLGMAANSPSNPWPLLYFGLALLSLGRILQQALERSLMMGMALTWVIMLTVVYVAQFITPLA